MNPSILDLAAGRVWCHGRSVTGYVTPFRRSGLLNQTFGGHRGDDVDIIHIIIFLAIVGLIWWLIETYVPIAEPFKTIIRVVMILALCLWLLNLFGIGSGYYIGVHH